MNMFYVSLVKTKRGFASIIKDSNLLYALELLLWRKKKKRV